MPDKDLKEIIIYGVYTPQEEYNIYEKDYKTYSFGPFQYSGMQYCYNETEEKHPAYDESLKMRLYDKEKKLLAEDFLRLEYYNEGHQLVIAYLPYREIRDAEIHMVKVKDGKETIIKTFFCCSSEKEIIKDVLRLRRLLKRNPNTWPVWGWTYYEDKECYS